MFLDAAFTPASYARALVQPVNAVLGLPEDA